MNGKVARSIRRISGFRPNLPRDYKAFQSGEHRYLEIDEEESAKMGETRLRLKTVPKLTYFQNDAARAVYRQTKKDYTKNRIK